MARTNTKYRPIAALILLGVMAAVFISLGNWQLHRAAQREAIKQAIQTGRDSAPLQLDAGTPRSELVNWRPAVVSGQWLDRYTILLENRNLNGRPGFWVATPLLLQADTNTAVLILRGWLPRPIEPGERLPSLKAPAGPQTVEGQLVDRVPRLFELWSFGDSAPSQLPPRLPAPDNTIPKLQNLDLASYADLTGLNLLPSVLEQTSGDGDRLERVWPGPSVDANQNKGYALQWFSFASIALIASLVIAWRTWRSFRKPA